MSLCDIYVQQIVALCDNLAVTFTDIQEKELFYEKNSEKMLLVKFGTSGALNIIQSLFVMLRAVS